MNQSLDAIGAPLFAAPAPAKGAAIPAVADKIRIAGLDELRGLSILWVMICHGAVLWTWMPLALNGYGFHGVVLFFIISGYLITRILLNSSAKEGYFSTFYINRLVRIWPLMLVALAVSALLWPSTARQAVFNLLMVNNYAYAYGVEPMMRTDVMWSLAIEEQFYLLWPACVFLLAGLWRGRALPFATAAIVVAGLCFDAGLLPGGDGIIFKTTHGNMQYIAIGALIAMEGGLRWMLGAWAAFVLAWLASHGVSDIGGFRYIWWGVTFALGLLVWATIHVRPLLRFAPLAYIGKLCYGIYIIHFFISWAVFEHFRNGVAWQGSLYLGLSLGLAALSFHFFELPLLGMRGRIIASPKARAALFAGAALVVLVSAVSMIPLLKNL